MPSWMTSVKAVRFFERPASRPKSTALAMLPTPDWRGSRSFGSRPVFTSSLEELEDVPGDPLDASSGAEKGAFRSGAFVSTMAMTLSGGT